MRFIQEDGSMSGVALRVAEVTKPLASVHRICFKGKHIYILHKRTGRRTPLLHDMSVYDMTVPVSKRRCGEIREELGGESATA